MTDFFAAAHRAQTRHGEATRKALTSTYKVWRYMRDRVARDPDYAHVTIDPRWDEYANFLSDMGEQPAGMTLDRVDPRGNYEPGNCRWASMKTQQRNRTNNKHLTYGGATRTVAEWAEVVGLKAKTLYTRLQAGWTVEDTLTKDAVGRGKYAGAFTKCKEPT